MIDGSFVWILRLIGQLDGKHVGEVHLATCKGGKGYFNYRHGFMLCLRLSCYWFCVVLIASHVRSNVESEPLYLLPLWIWLGSRGRFLTERFVRSTGEIERRSWNVRDNVSLLSVLSCRENLEKLELVISREGAEKESYIYLVAIAYERYKKKMLSVRPESEWINR